MLNLAIAAAFPAFETGGRILESYMLLGHTAAKRRVPPDRSRRDHQLLVHSTFKENSTMPHQRVLFRGHADSKRWYTWVYFNTNQANPLMDVRQQRAPRLVWFWEHSYYLKYQSGLNIWTRFGMWSTGIRWLNASRQHLNNFVLTTIPVAIPGLSFNAS